MKRTALRRIPREVLPRNVAIALGNTGSPDAVPALVALLAEKSPLVRVHAVWALRQLGDDAVLSAHVDADPDVLAELAAPPGAAEPEG